MNALTVRRFFLTILPAFTFLLSFGSAASHAADVTIKPGDKVITIDIRNGDQLDQILDWNLDIWSHHVGVGPVDVHVSAKELALIKAAGWNYKINNPDLTKSHALVRTEIQQRRNLRAAGDFDNYKTFDEIVTFINDLATARPDLVDPPFSIGQSIEGREIWMLHITGAGAGPKPAVFYHGLQHCREWITGPMVMYIADYLVNNYDTDPCIKSLLDSTDFYLAPCVNPDGYVHTWPPDDVRLWRKNRRNNGDGTFGVDLNRNWAYGWGGGKPRSNFRGLAARGSGQRRGMGLRSDRRRRRKRTVLPDAEPTRQHRCGRRLGALDLAHARPNRRQHSRQLRLLPPSNGC